MLAGLPVPRAGAGAAGDMQLKLAGSPFCSELLGTCGDLSITKNNTSMGFSRSRQVAKKPSWHGEAPELSCTARSCYH